MTEHRLEVADLFRTYEKEFFAKWGGVTGAAVRIFGQPRAAKKTGALPDVIECEPSGEDARKWGRTISQTLPTVPDQADDSPHDSGGSVLTAAGYIVSSKFCNSNPPPTTFPEGAAEVRPSTRSCLQNAV